VPCSFAGAHHVEKNDVIHVEPTSPPLYIPYPAAPIAAASKTTILKRRKFEGINDSKKGWRKNWKEGSTKWLNDGNILIKTTDINLPKYHRS
jgi:hypothetical protein